MPSSPVFRPVVIAGPCTAESLDIMTAVAEPMSRLARQLGFDYIFKASFDKANRTSAGSTRGPGLSKALEWFEIIKSRYSVPVLTDVHESHQVADVAAVCDVLQIPAFLCRQTDLVVAAAASGRDVNIKKGQFLAPNAMANILDKARQAAAAAGKNPRIWQTERGVTFGYGNLVVDMRALPIMAGHGAPVLLDITHSTQLPATGGQVGTSGAQRCHAPVLARAAAATGYLSGVFLEVHPDPVRAVSDADAQLTPRQAELLLSQVIPLISQARGWAEAIDRQFES